MTVVYGADVEDHRLDIRLAQPELNLIPFGNRDIALAFGVGEVVALRDSLLHALPRCGAELAAEAVVNELHEVRLAGAEIAAHPDTVVACAGVLDAAHDGGDAIDDLVREDILADFGVYRLIGQVVGRHRRVELAVDVFQIKVFELHRLFPFNLRERVRDMRDCRSTSRTGRIVRHGTRQGRRG